MSIKLLARFITVISLFLVTASPAGAATIADVEARLFYGSTGRMSPNIALPLKANPGQSDFALWNTIIGEGSAEAPSNQTVILVHFAGAPNSFVDGSLQLKVTNKETKKLVSQHTLRSVGFTSSSGRSTAMFVVSDTGCQQLEISARLVSSTGASGASTKVYVPFGCGE
jgi:hypothetical protein